MDLFTVFYGYIANKFLNNTKLIFFDIQQHLLLLSKHFTKYCLKETYENFDWILNPFVDAKTDVLGRENEELAELASGLRTRSIFNRVRIRVHKKIANSSLSYVLINLIKLINYFTHIRIFSLVKYEIITIYNILQRTLINLFYTYQMF